MLMRVRAVVSVERVRLRKVRGSGLPSEMTRTQIQFPNGEPFRDHQVYQGTSTHTILCVDRCTRCMPYFPLIVSSFISEDLATQRREGF